MLLKQMWVLLLRWLTGNQAKYYELLIFLIVQVCSPFSQKLMRVWH